MTARIQGPPIANPEHESMWAVGRRLAQTGNFANALFVEAELRKLGYAEVERLAGAGAERDLITATCVATRTRLGRSTLPSQRRPTMTESEARAALRPLGYRLSQRNQGFVILDLEHRYVATGYEKSGGSEIALVDVVAWMEAEAKTCRDQEPS